MAQAEDRPLIGRRHHPEQTRAGGVERIGHGEIGGERHRRVPILALAPGPEVQIPTAVAAPELLLGKLHPGGVPALLGQLDAAGELTETLRQLVRRDHLVSELGPTVDHRPFDAVEEGTPVRPDAHREHDGRSGPVGQQARGRLGEHRWVQARPPAGQEHGDAATPRLGVDRVTRPDEEADIGDRVVQHDIVSVAVDRERLVQIGRRRRIERDERIGGAIAVVIVRLTPSGLLGGGQHIGGELAGDVELLPDAFETGLDGLLGPFRQSHRQRRAPMNMPLRAS